MSIYLNFQKSEPFGNWSFVFDGTKDPEICPQFGIFIGSNKLIAGNEDCLYLNVFTPNVSSK